MVRKKVRSNAFRRYKDKEGYLEIRYYYDPLGQRIKSVKTVNAKPSGTTLFLMSGMIEHARAKVASGGKQLASIDFHTLGLDLAGSLTATGGVGSVLATSKTQTTGYYTRTYLYDGNGNVISLCKTDTGTITANYTYSPFGKLIKSGGIDKQIADFTFSTKYADETGLSYYGFRFYSAKLGRWLKRDVLKEEGSFNLFHVLSNNPINRIDILGLSDENQWTLDRKEVIQGEDKCVSTDDIGNYVRMYIRKRLPEYDETVWIPGMQGLSGDPDSYRNALIEKIDLLMVAFPEAEAYELTKKLVDSVSSVNYVEFKWEKQYYLTAIRDRECMCYNGYIYWSYTPITDTGIEYEWNSTYDIRSLDMHDYNKKLYDYIKDIVESVLKRRKK